MNENAPSAEQQPMVPSPRDPSKPFHVVLMTIYSVENAGIRYVSAALQRAGFETTIVFLRDWVHNRLDMPSEEEFRIVDRIIREKQPDLIGLGFMSSLLPMAKGRWAGAHARSGRVIPPLS